MNWHVSLPAVNAQQLSQLPSNRYSIWNANPSSNFVVWKKPRSVCKLFCSVGNPYVTNPDAQRKVPGTIDCPWNLPFLFSSKSTDLHYSHFLVKHDLHCLPGYVLQSGLCLIFTSDRVKILILKNDKDCHKESNRSKNEQ